MAEGWQTRDLIWNWLERFSSNLIDLLGRHPHSAFVRADGSSEGQSLRSSGGDSVGRQFRCYPSPCHARCTGVAAFQCLGHTFISLPSMGKTECLPQCLKGDWCKAILSSFQVASVSRIQNYLYCKQNSVMKLFFFFVSIVCPQLLCFAEGQQASRDQSDIWPCCLVWVLAKKVSWKLPPEYEMWSFNIYHHFITTDMAVKILQPLLEQPHRL